MAQVPYSQRLDANPEAILVGVPLDGSRHSDTFQIGDPFEDITGVIQFQKRSNTGAFFILPTKNLTRLNAVGRGSAPPTTLFSDRGCAGLTVGDYNVENFAPQATAHVQGIAAHIVNLLRSPDILFLQEIQDNSGKKDDSTVDADKTLSSLVEAIRGASNGTVNYNFTQINPEDGMDGGEGGGNIRVAYLYNSEVVRLVSGTPGGSTDKNEVQPGPELKFNPGRIDPASPAWEVTRKPLAAHWETVDGNGKLFTINVHWSSKRGGSSLQGDARPPVNSPMEKRTQQAEVTAVSISASITPGPPI